MATAVNVIDDGTGELRQLGNLIPLGGIVGAEERWKVYGDDPTTPLLKRELWVPRTRPTYAPKYTKNQKQTNMCNSFAITAGVEACRRMAGFKEIRLSPAYSYGGINNGVDGGSGLEPGLERAVAKGNIPEGLLPEFQWQPGTWPAGLDETAQHFRVLEYYLCPTFDHIMSAIMMGFPVIIGIFWGRSDSLNSMGWLTAEPSGGIAGGHAMLSLSPEKTGSRWGLRTLNSWGPAWGINGDGIIPEERFPNMNNSRGIPFTGAWASRVVTVAPGDIDLLPSPTAAIANAA
jgi:hypothetical protein